MQLRQAVDVAAQIGVLGLDPLKFLNTRDPAERYLMIRLARRMEHYHKEMHKHLAGQIAQVIARAMGAK